MNDRIQKLKLQAIKLVAESYPCDIEDFTDALDERVRAKVDEKFAELIVRQMLDITDAHTEVFQTDRDRALIEHIKQSVKQHFGVE